MEIGKSDLPEKRELIDKIEHFHEYIADIQIKQNEKLDSATLEIHNLARELTGNTPVKIFEE